MGFVLDVRRGQHRPAVLKDVAYVDAAGKQVAIYGDNFYGPGNVTFSQLYSELLAGEEHSPARSRDHCHFVPGYDGVHWFGSGFVWAGNPPEPVHEDDQGTVIPDLGRNLYYSLKDGVLTARILSGSLPEVGHVSYEFSPEFQGGSLLYDHRTLRFYQPVADEGFRIDFPGKPNRHVLRGRRPAGDEGFLAGFFGQPSRQQETDGEGNESIGYGYLHPDSPAAYLVAITTLGEAAGADPDAMLAPEDAGAAHIARFLDSFQLTGAMAQKGGSASHRTWTDATGKFSVEAELVKAVGDSVVLPTTDGAERTVALARLSAADRQYVQDRDSGNPAVVAQLEKRLKIIGLAQHDHMFKYKLEYAADSPYNKPLLAKMPQVFATPAMRTSDLTNERLKELVTIADGKPDSPD